MAEYIIDFSSDESYLPRADIRSVAIYLKDAGMVREHIVRCKDCVYYDYGSCKKFSTKFSGCHCCSSEEWEADVISVSYCSFGEAKNDTD